MMCFKFKAQTRQAQGTRYRQQVRFWMMLLCFACTATLHAKNEETVPEEYLELYRIIESEQALVERMRSNLAPEKLDSEIELRLGEIDEAYRAYIDKFPLNTFGQILYGKFLRKANRPEDAYAIFLDIQEDNPDIAVVNQHLALFASEIGDFENAYRYFMRALELEPETALFHYQMGEFLHAYKNPLVREIPLPVSDVEQRMLAHFEKAHQLAPDNRDFHARWAEAFFDVFNPDWSRALEIWDTLLATSSQQFERDVLRLQKARVLVETRKFWEAGELIRSVRDPALSEAKDQLLARIP
jgi:tetratricopeptide (TPR) repeat protein